jgi:hypothetical protein
MDKEFTLKVGELALLETLPGCSKQMRGCIPDYWPTALIPGQLMSYLRQLLTDITYSQLAVGAICCRGVVEAAVEAVVEAAL